MEIKRYVNGRTVSEKELHLMKITTPEMTDAVNEVRRRTVITQSENTPRVRTDG